MIEQLQTIREALEIERFACIHESLEVPDHLVGALAALDQIEAAVGEPVADINVRPTESGGVRASVFWHKLPVGSWLLYRAAPVAQQYEAGDMASAAAQGFRDGVASVTAGREPVALSRDEQRLRLWQAIQGAAKAGVAHDDKLIVEELRQAGYCIAAAPVAQQPQARPDFTDEWTGYLKNGETPFERFLRERKDLTTLTKLYQRALEENESLKAQQPQAEPDIHEAQGQIEFLDKKNNALSAAIRKVMARLADLLDEDQFKEIEEAISSAGVQPQAGAYGYVDETGEPVRYENKAHRTEMKNAVRFGGLRELFLSSPQQAEAVPPGWVLVPVSLLKDSRWRIANLVGSEGAKGADRKVLDALDAVIDAATAQQKGQS